MIRKKRGIKIVKNHKIGTSKMIQRLRQVVVTLIASVALLAPVAVPVMVYAAAPSVSNGLCQGASLQISADNSCPDTTAAATDSVNTIITTVINIFSIVVGVVAVIMIIVGGLKYITSGGDSGNVTGAKNTILYAVIGLVVVALAQVIVKFVLGKSNV